MSSQRSQRRKSTALSQGRSTVEKKRRGGKANLGVEFQAARKKGEKRTDLVTPKSTGKVITVTTTHNLTLKMIATKKNITIKITFKGSDKVLSRTAIKKRKYPTYETLNRKNLEAVGKRTGGTFDKPTELYVLTIKKIIHEHIKKDAVKKVTLKTSDADFYNKVEKDLKITLTIDVNGDKSEKMRNQTPGRAGSRLQQEAMADDLPFVHNMVVEEESEAQSEEEFSEEESEAQLTACEILGESLFLGLKF